MSVDKKLLKEHIIKYVVVGIFSWFLLSVPMFISSFSALKYNKDKLEVNKLETIIQKNEDESVFYADTSKILKNHGERLNKFRDMNLSFSDIYILKLEVEKEYGYLKKYNPDDLISIKFYYLALLDLLKKESLLWDEVEDALTEGKDKSYIMLHSSFKNYLSSFYTLAGTHKGVLTKIKSNSKILRDSLSHYSSKTNKKIFDFILASISLLLSCSLSILLIWFLFFDKKIKITKYN